MIIDVVAGARPNYVKVAALYHAFEEDGYTASGHKFRLVETGQHYDEAMSEGLARQLELPQPFVRLHAQVHPPSALLPSVIERYQLHLEKHRPDLTVVVGDVTSTLACTLAAKNLQVPVAHVEAGLRSGDHTMPEERNRIATDVLSDYLFAPTASAAENLLKAGLDPNRIYLTGNTMVDTLYRFLPQASASPFPEIQNLTPQEYVILTQHRPTNVDDQRRLKTLLYEVADGAGEMPVVFPIHPRTLKQLSGIALPPIIRLTPPLPYFHMLHLQQHARGIITDSGGLCEEASALQIPCIITRPNTERPEMIEQGTGVLCMPGEGQVTSLLQQMIGGQWKKGYLPDCWDGHAAHRTWKVLLANT